MTTFSRLLDSTAGRAVAFGVAACLFVGASACGDESGPSPWCAALPDATPSSASPELQARILGVVEQVVDYCAEHNGSLYVDAIVNNGPGSPVKPVSMSLVPADLRDNKAYDAAARAALTDQARDAVEELLKKAVPGGGGSDYLGSFKSVATQASTVEKGHPMFLVVAGDGLQTAGVNLTAGPLDDEAIESLLAEIQANGLMADFSGLGLRVYMVGVGAGEGADQLDPSRLAGIERFWRAYFEQAHAELVTYTKVLARFP
jgi:hypothetical protein